MVVPKFYEFFNVFLESLKDGDVHSYNDLNLYIKQRMNFSEYDLAETIPSGQPRWLNRLNWCRTYLKKSGLITNPKRGYFQITSEGKRLLDEGVKITVKLLIERYPEFSKFRDGKKTPVLPTVEEIAEETPQESLNRIYKEINFDLAEEILIAVHSMSWRFFERLVVKLMEEMGYGGYEGAGRLTKSGSDGGIDGVIDEDKLGFNQIYIQAKRWELDTVVGRPEIQKFVGALVDQPKIGKGLYITTAKFSDTARNYAKDQHVILIDGQTLAILMIEFDIGVSTQKTYKITRIDNDFFDEDE